MRGGSWSVGTKDDDTVYLDRYTGDLVDGKPTGHVIVNANMNAREARNIGLALLQKADKIDPNGAETYDPKWMAKAVQYAAFDQTPVPPAQGRNGRWVKLGDVSVDGATIGITDPSAVGRRIDWDWGTPPGAKQPISQSYGSGVQFWAGFGDGNYEVWAWMVTYPTPSNPDDERVAFVAMTLVNEDDLVQWNES